MAEVKKISTATATPFAEGFKLLALGSDDVVRKITTSGVLRLVPFLLKAMETVDSTDDTLRPGIFKISGSTTETITGVGSTAWAMVVSVQGGGDIAQLLIGTKMLAYRFCSNGAAKAWNVVAVK